MTREVWIGLPYDGCQQNNPRHWRIRQQAVKTYREECAWSYHAAKLPRYETTITIHSDWYMPRKREKGVYKPEDKFNAAGALKSAVDALIDAQVVMDDTDKFVDIGSIVFHREAHPERGTGIMLRLEVDTEYSA